MIAETKASTSDPRVRRAGWSLGSTCPFGCKHCYTAVSRSTAGEITVEQIHQVIDSFAELGVESVVLGGNEPIYAGSSDPKASLLPLIIDSLVAADIKPILITSGLTTRFLKMHFADKIPLLAAMVISLDSPNAEDHNANRGAPLFDIARQANCTSAEHGVPTLICVTPTRANFSVESLDGFIALSSEWGALLRMNTYKSAAGLDDPQAVSIEQYWTGFGHLVERCTTLVVDEPPLFPWFDRTAPPNCGRSSIRVGFPTVQGEIPITPCQYRPEFASHGYGGPMKSPAGRNRLCIDYLAYGNPPFTPASALVDSSPTADLFTDYLCTWVGQPR
ncbi:MAG: radical SAM protein [Candidatus Nanopelagicales bacterium]|nr:radical SAM protein [Candidatus Nanopelagicales bacterium]